MNRQQGFTLIELLITMSVMTILLTLAVVSLNATQVNARDEERKTDIATIARSLESFYSSGGGEYPDTSKTSTETLVKTTLPDIDVAALRAPTVATTNPMSFTNASSASTPTPALNVYIYQPLTSADALCTTGSDECRKFNLYYILEQDGTTQKITSKNQ